MIVEDLIRLHPRLFHMAEVGTWPSISKLGLLSTSAALDLCGIDGVDRLRLEASHRPEKVTINDGQGRVRIVLRDQKPMPEARIRAALIDGTTPSRWYQLINNKVFFWADEHRLLGLLKARAYRNLEHDVLTVDTRSLLAAHSQHVRLCHMNSGNTFPVGHKRGIDIFKRIPDYPCKPSGEPLKRVVELVVDDKVHDIQSHVVCIRRMKGDAVLKDLLK